MKKIVNNYLLMDNQRDFNNTLMKYFYERLQLFLCVDGVKEPDLLFTKDENKIRQYYTDSVLCRAFYDDDHEIIVFNGNRYDRKSKEFTIDISDLDTVALNGFRYCISLSDIYHEMIHRFQNYYNYDLYQQSNTDFIEATDEIFTFILTGQLSSSKS